MIADQEPSRPAVGALASTVHDSGRFIQSVILFVERQLPLWFDHPKRPAVSDETRMNEYLCDHLDTQARTSGFDVVRFTHESCQTGGRTVDVTVKPCGPIIVEGRAYSEFEQLLPIECKRLPTPKGNKRGDVEYVNGTPSHISGGIERFKHGLHGPASNRGLLIGYVQSESFEYWFEIVNQRLRTLAELGTDDGLWFPEELLDAAEAIDRHRVRRFASRHQRLNPPGISDVVALEHLWLRMN
jgi:hypothetical protein